MPNYSDRKLSSVTVFSLEAVQFGEGEHGVSGVVTIQVSRMDGDASGPQATVTLAVPCEADVTIDQAEDALIEGAIGILRRMAQEEHPALKASLIHGRKEAFLKLSPEL